VIPIRANRFLVNGNDEDDTTLARCRGRSHWRQSRILGWPRRDRGRCRVHSWLRSRVADIDNLTFFYVSKICTAAIVCAIIRILIDIIIYPSLVHLLFTTPPKWLGLGYSVVCK
jgi:hypothetical protein